MKLNRTTAIVAVLALLVSAVAVPGLAAADEHVDVTVEQQSDTGEALVTVTEDDEAVENATVLVDTNDTYDGTGEYETDENGTVVLPNPEETVDVTLTVNVSGDVRTVEAELVPREDSLAIDVEDADEDNATVTVTQYGEEVEGANVSVEGDDYAANGTYETDGDGEFVLPVPEEPTEVTLNASYDNLSAEETVTLGEHELELDVDQDDDGVTVEVTRNDIGVEGANVTVEAAENESYVDEGEYETDENGTVGLSTPEETVTVTVTATDGDDTVSENVTLENSTVEFRTFGGQISAFVHQLLSGATGPGIGDEVSEFARENNPGNADENADNGDEANDDKGKPDDVPGKGDEMRDEKNGDDGDDGDDSDDSDDASSQTTAEDDESDEEEDEEEDKEDEEDDDDSAGNNGNGGGPPDHANN